MTTSGEKGGGDFSSSKAEGGMRRRERIL